MSALHTPSNISGSSYTSQYQSPTRNWHYKRCKYDTRRFFFFFSSRRRHTRFGCDWSSHVCSSDLATADGRGQIRAIKIDPQAIAQGDVEMLEDLVLAAVSQAQQRAAELYQAEVKKLASGLPFPFQLPL